MRTLKQALSSNTVNLVKEDIKNYIDKNFVVSCKHSMDVEFGGCSCYDKIIDTVYNRFLLKFGAYFSIFDEDNRLDEYNVNAIVTGCYDFNYEANYTYNVRKGFSKNIFEKLLRIAKRVTPLDKCSSSRYPCNNLVLNLIITTLLSTNDWVSSVYAYSDYNQKELFGRNYVFHSLNICDPSQRVAQGINLPDKFNQKWAKKSNEVKNNNAFYNLMAPKIKPLLEEYLCSEFNLVCKEHGKYLYSCGDCYCKVIRNLTKGVLSKIYSLQYNTTKIQPKSDAADKTFINQLSFYNHFCKSCSMKKMCLRKNRKSTMKASTLQTVCLYRLKIALNNIATLGLFVTDYLLINGKVDGVAPITTAKVKNDPGKWLLSAVDLCFVKYDGKALTKAKAAIKNISENQSVYNNKKSKYNSGNNASWYNHPYAGQYDDCYYGSYGCGVEKEFNKKAVILEGV